jgi:demethylmenaquinone methyltransferase/2-methoxy-6-polyprenyl-1,4-benzoquinol methylase
LWRRLTAEFAARKGGVVWVDVCSGTGEMALSLHHLAAANTRVIGIDFSSPMLRKAGRKPGADGVLFVLADAKALPIRSGSLDILTVAFAIRNIRVSDQALVWTLEEFHRVLKPSGLLVTLETSQPSSKLIRWSFRFYVKWLIKMIGHTVSGSSSAYAYLSSTVLSFYSTEGFAEILHEAGFSRVRFHHMMSGIVAIHEARKWSM